MHQEGGKKLKVLFIGDVVGKPGRDCLKIMIPELKSKYELDFIIANGENLAGGLGITSEVANELFANGVNVITGGNHIWDKKEVFNFIDEEPRLLRPMNYPPGTPGQGSECYQVNNDLLGVINLSGRVFISELDCPFRTVEEEIAKMRAKTPFIIIDFHAEATSEKNAMGYFLRKKVSAVLGTHTHVQTADEKIMDNVTAYITDVGMTGPYESVIGINVDSAIEKFITKIPMKLHVSNLKPLQFNAVYLEFNSEGNCIEIKRIFKIVK